MKHSWAAWKDLPEMPQIWRFWSFSPGFDPLLEFYILLFFKIKKKLWSFVFSVVSLRAERLHGGEGVSKWQAAKIL